MSKRVIFILCLAIFGLAACASGSNGPDESAIDEQAEQTEQTIQEAEQAAQAAEDAAPVELERVAVAPLQSRSDSEVTGLVTFTETLVPQDDGSAQPQVVVSYEISGLTPGETRGFHVHETGDCSAPDATSAGGHFNPTDHAHGPMEAEDSHAGDLGNITADAEGNAVGVIENITKFTLADGEANNIVGRAVIVHAQQDDLVSQPTGDAGARVACAVIATQE